MIKVEILFKIKKVQRAIKTMVVETQMKLDQEEIEMTDAPEEDELEIQIDQVPITNDIKIEAFIKVVMR